MDVTLTLVVAGLTLPIWLPLVLWYAADQDDKAAVDGSPADKKDKAFRHARAPRSAKAWTGNAVPHSQRSSAALEA
jgi:hypothetical protein